MMLQSGVLEQAQRDFKRDGGAKSGITCDETIYKSVYCFIENKSGLC